MNKPRVIYIDSDGRPFSQPMPVIRYRDPFGVTLPVLAKPVAMDLAIIAAMTAPGGFTGAGGAGARV